MAEDIEIRLADGTFATLQNSTGKAIWTDQQDTRIIKRIHKFDTLETDPPLYGIGGNWMTESHFIWGRTDSKWQRAFEFQGINKVKKRTPKGPVFAVELDTDDCLTLQGGRPGGYLWKLPDSGTIQTRLYSRFPFQHGPGFYDVRTS